MNKDEESRVGKRRQEGNSKLCAYRKKDKKNRAALVNIATPLLKEPLFRHSIYLPLLRFFSTVFFSSALTPHYK
jgi:hypothetical protein